MEKESKAADKSKAKKQVPLLRRRHAEEILQNGKMAGTGYRQELRYALHQPQNDRIQYRHLTALLIM